MFFGKKVTGPAEWLLVCLGNYGKQYENTRHNIGFMAAERLIDKQGLRCNRLRFRALTELIEFGGARVLLMMPRTYMNLSGEAVGEAARFYKIPSDHVLVIYDDVSLPLGKLRIRDKGSAGGHNGIKNIIAHLGTDVFPRVKVGVGAPSHPDYDMVDWVIGSFSAQERKIVDEALDRALDAAECIISRGVTASTEKTLRGGRQSRLREKFIIRLFTFLLRRSILPEEKFFSDISGEHGKRCVWVQTVRPGTICALLRVAAKKEGTFMQELNRQMMALPELRELEEIIRFGTGPAAVSGVSGVHRAMLGAALRQETKRPLAVLCADEQEARRMAADLAALTGEECVTLFAREWQLRDRVSASHSFEQERLDALCRMAFGRTGIVVATVDGMLQRTLPPTALRDAVLTLRLGEEHDLRALAERLTAAGYVRCEQVEGAGQFAVRGGILDVYSPMSAPVRVEFFDTEIDAMGEFDVATQRRTKNLEELTVLPAAEVLPFAAEGGRDAMLARMEHAAAQLAKKVTTCARACRSAAWTATLPPPTRPPSARRTICRRGASCSSARAAASWSARRAAPLNGART